MRLRSVLARDDGTLSGGGATKEKKKSGALSGDMEFTSLMSDDQNYAGGADTDGVVLYLEVRVNFRNTRTSCRP